ncbi:hypothetical protein BDZ97DRAFT_901494 [Flammula alnicola]|nr:hypothetical protein BDZ97DRAFT_901494 [Flammula alnicola]
MLKSRSTTMGSFNAEIVLGPMFLGFIFNAVLLGVLATQVYIYYTQYKRDNIWIKAAVVALFTVNVLNSVFIIVYIYRILIIFLGNTSHLLNMDWLVVSEPFSTVVIAFSVQSFFAWRTAVGGILTARGFARSPSFDDVRDSKTFIILWLLSGVICNVFIAAIRLWYLWTTHTQKLSNSDLMVDRIIRVILGTGLLTLAVAATDLIVYMKFKGTGMHLIFNLPLCKVFSNNFMNSLNSRHGWKNRWSSEISPHSLFHRGDVRPGDVIEFVGFKTTMVSDQSESQTQFDDTVGKLSTTTLTDEQTNENHGRHDQWL